MFSGEKNENRRFLILILFLSARSFFLRRLEMNQQQPRINIRMVPPQRNEVLGQAEMRARDAARNRNLAALAESAARHQNIVAAVPVTVHPLPPTKRRFATVDPDEFMQVVAEMEAGKEVHLRQAAKRVAVVPGNEEPVCLMLVAVLDAIRSRHSA